MIRGWGASQLFESEVISHGQDFNTFPLVVRQGNIFGKPSEGSTRWRWPQRRYFGVNENRFDTVVTNTPDRDTDGHAAAARIHHHKATAATTQPTASRRPHRHRLGCADRDAERPHRPSIRLRRPQPRRPHRPSTPLPDPRHRRPLPRASARKASDSAAVPPFNAKHTTATATQDGRAMVAITAQCQTTTDADRDTYSCGNARHTQRHTRATKATSRTTTGQQRRHQGNNNRPQRLRAAQSRAQAGRRHRQSFISLTTPLPQTRHNSPDAPRHPYPRNHNVRPARPDLRHRHHRAAGRSTIVGTDPKTTGTRSRSPASRGASGSTRT